MSEHPPDAAGGGYQDHDGEEVNKNDSGKKFLEKIFVDVKRQTTESLQSSLCKISKKRLTLKIILNFIIKAMNCTYFLRKTILHGLNS